MDSGVGGISVLQKMVKLMPAEDFLFFGDSANAPYGTKTTEEVRELVFRAVAAFLEEGAKAVAIACNTATSAAVRDLRLHYPDLPIVGIEPALKPAVERHPGGRILVMATPMTIREEKFHLLLSRFEDKAKIIPMACPGLMEYVESGQADSDEVEAFLKDLLKEFIIKLDSSQSAKNNISNKKFPCTSLDAVVLGCTHYPFVTHRIRNVLGEDVDILDGSLGTARELKRRLSEAGLLRDEARPAGQVVFRNSDPSPEKIALSRKLLNHEKL